MPKVYTIVIDTLGSDKGPEAILEGARLALEQFPNLNLVLVGDEELIKSKNLDPNRIRIIHTLETITNYDKAGVAFYKNPNVSVFLALKECADNDNVIGMINAGNTGALIVGCIRYLLDANRTRPCLAAILPTTTNGFTCLVDTGASIDVGPQQLHEFARLGSDFMGRLFKIEAPRVGLLSNGTEPTKGNKLVKEAHQILVEDKSLNFVGNVEGNKVLNGQCDVLVCEGFAGNQVLKVSEGMAVNLITEIVMLGKKTGNPECMKIAGHLMQTYNFESLGAGIILGARKLVMKCRGSSGPQAIVSTAQILLNLAENKSFYEGLDKREK